MHLFYTKMSYIIVLVACCFAAASAAPRSPARIVGGSVTTIDQYPTIAALLYSINLQTYTQSCGGTIITTTAVLTAAHCPFGDAVNRWRIRAGSSYASSGGTVYTLASITLHPSYNNNTQDNDIAIMRTATTMVFSTLVQSASIASANYILADNQVVWAAGWGTTSFNGAASEQLRHVQVWTINQATCNTRYGGLITDNMLCSGYLDVGGRDQCQGDSGGPLYHNNVVVGITSWGSGCASSYYPGVNARVSRYTSWISANV